MPLRQSRQFAIESLQQLLLPEALPEALTEASLQSPDHDSHQLKAVDISYNRSMHALKQPYTSSQPLS